MAAAMLLGRDEAEAPVEIEREHGEKRSECGVLMRHSGHHFRGRERPQEERKGRSRSSAHADNGGSPDSAPQTSALGVRGCAPEKGSAGARVVQGRGRRVRQLQQATTTSNINIPSASAVVAGEGNLLQYRQAMAAEALSEGGGSRDGSAPAAQANVQPRSMSERSKLLRIPKPEPGLRCPRCDSTSTKFCYFNNYSFAQPRHFCRNCHRYWTRGGALRDVPVGAPYRRRRAKGSKPTAAATAASASSAALVMTSSCTTNVVRLAPTPQQATASSSASPLLPQLYGLASMDTPNVGSKFSWPGAANLLVVSAGGGLYRSRRWSSCGERYRSLRRCTGSQYSRTLLISSRGRQLLCR
ncbi:unnamed protein product [Miscanthus lutarioriparius]|uniref:Dof-type domain-containing protein n=1 Tax=Miscanthus lutarioriparius TaxID=422564 RepID=A0A811Q1J1_9POAL|nr:unnamed protein product [Miscanthus lutarioriparius]